jgi:hypothetical protein
VRGSIFSVINYALTKCHINTYILELGEKRRDEFRPVVTMKPNGLLCTIGMGIREVGESDRLGCRDPLACDLVVRNPRLIIDTIHLFSQVWPIELEVANDM